MSEQGYKWTAKGPLLIAGAVLTVLGLLLRTRKGRWAALAGGVLIVAGIGIFIEAATMANWCAPNEQKFGAMTWGQPFHETPGLTQCWKLVW